MSIVRVAVPSPLRRAFDYGIDDGALIEPGMRVEVPFARRRVVGVVLEVGVASDVAPAKLKTVTRVLDSTPTLDSSQLELVRFAARYYHHPIGEVAQTFLPSALRRVEQTGEGGVRRWQVTEVGRSIDPGELARAPRQAAVLAVLLEAGEAGLTRAEVETFTERADNALRALAARGLVEASRHEPALLPPLPPAPEVALSAAQAEAVAAVTEALGGFEAFVLDGVTGSGKTEVYLRAIEAALARDLGVLVLVPEIGLTPQMLDRFRTRLRIPLLVTHSGLADGARAGAWALARAGRSPVVVGTRSAVFMPVARLGLVIVDEEHDASYKQQDGLRYSARDLALVRARAAGAPALLGSATPSLESLSNVRRGRFRHLVLTERAGGAARPDLRVVDLRGRWIEGHLSATALDLAATRIERGEQVLFFVNRRGFAPTLLCHACGHVHDCPRCDARLVLHRRNERLRCHHCGLDRRAPHECAECGSTELRPVGAGTERLESELAERFPNVSIARIDRDTTRRRGSLESALELARDGSTQLLIGTQMLAKGHHFPGVTLVVIVDADGGLFSADFRATERMAQLVTQVAGRAGRAERAGLVLVQTHQPEHPLLTALEHGSYASFAQAALAEREMTGLPPAGSIALLRAESPAMAPAMAFLEAARDCCTPGEAHLLGPVPAPMERRQGRFRAQLMLMARERSQLQRALEGWAERLEVLSAARRVRWSLDVDPQDMS